MVGVLGIFFIDFTGSGHALIDKIIGGHDFSPLFLALCLLIRACLLLLANNAGITGGIFVPSVAFGAIIGKLCSMGLIAAGLLPQSYELIMVVIGMASFLAASFSASLRALLTFAGE